jgi:hypothetical protein
VLRPWQSSVVALLLTVVSSGCGVDLPEVGSLPAGALVAHWPLDEAAGDAAHDRVGAHDGSLAGGASWTSKGGVAGLSFDGDDNRVALAPFDIASAQLSLTAWVWAAGGNTVLENRIIAKADGAGPQKHYWLLGLDDQAEPGLRFRLKTSPSDVTESFDGTRSLPTEQWVFVAATYDGSLMRLYQGDELVGAHAHSGAVAQAPTVPVAIGSNPEVYRTFLGAISDVRIYRRALTAQEIAAFARR